MDADPATTTSARLEEIVTLLDWKRRVFELYREVREAPVPKPAWEWWRRVRDELFRAHPQSPLSSGERSDFSGLDYFPYDPSARVVAQVRPAVRETVPIGASAGETIRFERFGQAVFTLGDETQTLDLYWLEAYGGGLFLPFGDGTNAADTYPAGRYILDTVKGADLGTVADGLVLDFNFAYNPSCAYDPRWVCPLAPPANRLALDIRAGERAPRTTGSA